MTWVKLDDGFFENAKVMRLTDRAVRLYLASLCLSNRNLTDGLITPQHRKVLYALTSSNAKHAAELTTAGLWLNTDAGNVIRSYLEYQPSAADVKAHRAKAAERQAALRRRRNEARDIVEDSLSNAVTNSVTNAVSHRSPAPTPTRIIPERSSRSLSFNQGPDNSPLGKLRRACRVLEGSDDETKLIRAMRGCSEADILDIATKAPADVRDRFGWTLSELKRRKTRAA
jgi:hypothetical protein